MIKLFHRPNSIKSRIILVNLVSVGLSLFLVLILFIYFYFVQERVNVKNHLQIQTDIIANNAIPALVFEDVEAAKEVLTALQADRKIVRAEVLTSENEVFASYIRSNAPNPSFALTIASSLKIHFNTSMDFSQKIIYKERFLGQIQLKAELSDLYEQCLQFSFFSFVVTLLTLLVTSGFSGFIFNKIIFPITELNGTARKIMNTRNYSIRAKYISLDEVGELTQSFNTMLDVIQQKDWQLEKTIAERTSELIQLNKKLQHLAYHDSLTGLANRTLFEDRLLVALNHANRLKKKFAVFYFDLDRFKAINDTFGHDTGDALLIEVTQRLKQIIRKNDTLARIGGDEFILIYENVESEKSVEHFARKILNIFSEPFYSCDHELVISGSIGISLYPKDATSTEGLKQYADLAMYFSKNSGRNNYSFFNTQMLGQNKQEMDGRLLLKQQLTSSIKNHQMQIFYQPQVDKSQNVIALEALLRWGDPTDQNAWVSPDIFIPLAEESGIIQGLEEWAFNEIISHYSQWQLNRKTEIKISINISSYRLRQQGFFDFVQHSLSKLALNPNFLIFEIDENELMKNLSEIQSVLNRLHEIGIGIAVDNFGSSYTSLNYLQQLPIDQFKISSDYVRQLGITPENPNMINAIINLANSLHKKAIAVGVEREEQASYLFQSGCFAMQGYLFAKPMAANNVTKLLSESVFLKEKP